MFLIMEKYEINMINLFKCFERDLDWKIWIIECLKVFNSNKRIYHFPQHFSAVNSITFGIWV